MRLIILFLLLSLSASAQQNKLIWFLMGNSTPGGGPSPSPANYVHTTVTISGNPVNIFIYEPEGMNLMSSVPVLLFYGGDGTDNNETTAVTGEAMSTGNDLTYTFTPASLGGNRVISKSVVVKVNGTPVGYGQWGGTITGTGISTGTTGSLTSATPNFSVTFSSSQSGNSITLDYVHSAMFFEAVPYMMNHGDEFDNKGLVVAVQNRGNNTDLALDYFTEVMKYLWANYTINPDRINMTGLSRGGRQVMNSSVNISYEDLKEFWFTNSDGTILTTDPEDVVNYTKSGIASVSYATGQTGGTYSHPYSYVTAIAGVMGTNDSGFGGVQNPGPNLASTYGAQTYNEYPYTRNIWNGTHSASVWHDEFYHRMFSGVSGKANAKWDYIAWHWRYSMDLEECATLFVEDAETKRGSEAYQIIAYREAVRKVAELSSGATKTALEGRLATLKTDLDGDITWRLIIAHGTSTVNYSGSGYNTMTSHTDNQRVDDLKDDNNNTLSGVDFFIGNNPLSSNFQAEISSNRGMNNAGGFPLNVNRSGFRIAQASGVCPMGFDGLPSGSYKLRVYANEGSGSFLERSITATIDGNTVTQFMQGGSLYTFAEWTGDEADFASFSLGAVASELYVTAIELIRLN